MRLLVCLIPVLEMCIRDRMYDVLEIEKKKEPGIVLTTNIPYVPTDERNLVYLSLIHICFVFSLSAALILLTGCLSGVCWKSSWIRGFRW